MVLQSGFEVVIDGNRKRDGHGLVVAAANQRALSKCQVESTTPQQFSLPTRVDGGVHVELYGLCTRRFAEENDSYKEANGESEQTDEDGDNPVKNFNRAGLERRTSELDDENLTDQCSGDNGHEKLVVVHLAKYVENSVNSSAIDFVTNVEEHKSVEDDRSDNTVAFECQFADVWIFRICDSFKVKELRAGIQHSKRGSTKEDGLSDYHAHHIPVDKTFPFVVDRWPRKDLIFIRFVRCKCERAERIH